jgi:hypothetical protein
MVIQKKDNVTLDFMNMNLNADTEDEKSSKKKGKDKIQKIIIQMFNKRINQIINDALNIDVD